MRKKWTLVRAYHAPESANMYALECKESGWNTKVRPEFGGFALYVDTTLRHWSYAEAYLISERIARQNAIAQALIAKTLAERNAK